LKKRISVLLLAAVLALTGSGCASAFEDEYYYEEPFSGEIGSLSGDIREVSNYSMLKTALAGMISRREEQCDFRLNNYNGSPSEDLASVCYEVKSANPMGAYAVETISYETSYVISYYIATVYITYQRTAEELLSVRYAATLNDFDEILGSALLTYDPRTVIRIYSPGADETYIRSFVKKYYYEHPATQVFEPTVSVETYPMEGPNHIFDIRLDYGLPASLLPFMAMETEIIVSDTAASMRKTETRPAYLALNAAAYLSALCTDPEVESGYIGTAYGAINRHCADDRGFALAYRALCEALGVQCLVAEGSNGDRRGEPHFWNIIGLDGEWYHVDLSAFADNPAGAFLLSDDTMWGRYIWETGAYPVCAGTLSYASLMPSAEPEETETVAREENLEKVETDA